MAGMEGLWQGASPAVLRLTKERNFGESLSSCLSPILANPRENVLARLPGAPALISANGVSVQALEAQPHLAVAVIEKRLTAHL